jgi:hypothetical protein
LHSLSAVIIGVEDFQTQSGSNANNLSLSKSQSDLTIHIGTNASTLGYDGYGYTQNVLSELNDGTYGATKSIENPSTEDLAWKFGNSANQILGDIRITNNSNENFKLTHIHFDAKNEFDNNRPNKIEILYIATGSNFVKGATVETATAIPDSKPFFNYTWTNAETIQINRSVGAALEGTGWLAPGDSAIFRIKWSGQATSSNIGLTYIDNFAFEGQFFPNTNEDTEIELNPLPDGYVLVGTSDFTALSPSDDRNLATTTILEGDLQLDIGSTASSLGRDGYGISTSPLSGLNDNSYGANLEITNPSDINSAWRFGNSGNQFQGDIKITNNGTLPLKLTHIHFDARNAFGSNHKKKLELLYLATGSNLLKGPSVDAGIPLDNLKPFFNYTWENTETIEINRSIGNAVDGQAWLAPGDSASFRFKWSENQGTGLGETQIDNLAFQGIFVEPSEDDIVIVTPKLSIAYINASNLLMNWETTDGDSYKLESANHPDGPYSSVIGFENFSSDTVSAFVDPTNFGTRAFFKLSRLSD